MYNPWHRIRRKRWQISKGAFQQHAYLIIENKKPYCVFCAKKSYSNKVIMTALSTKAFCKQVTGVFNASNDEKIKKICEDNKHTIYTILKNYKKYTINKITGSSSKNASSYTKKSPSKITMNAFIDSQISEEFESDTGNFSIEIDIDELTEIAKQFPGVTLDAYNKLPDDDKESICMQKNIKELYLQLRDLKFKPAQIKAIIVRVANHVSLPIIPFEKEDGKKASPDSRKKASPDSRKKASPVTKTIKRKGLNKLRSFQSYIAKDGFFTDSSCDDDIAMIRKFIESIPGENIVKMTNIWKNLSVEDKGVIDEFYASFPDADDITDKAHKAKIAGAFFQENGADAIALFKSVGMKEISVSGAGAISGIGAGSSAIATEECKDDNKEKKGKKAPAFKKNTGTGTGISTGTVKEPLPKKPEAQAKKASPFAKSSKPKSDEDEEDYEDEVEDEEDDE
jgi:hypothetical protein